MYKPKTRKTQAGQSQHFMFLFLRSSLKYQPFIAFCFQKGCGNFRISILKCHCLSNSEAQPFLPVLLISNNWQVLRKKYLGKKKKSFLPFLKTLQSTLQHKCKLHQSSASIAFVLSQLPMTQTKRLWSLHPTQFTFLYTLSIQKAGAEDGGLRGQ